MLARTWDGRPSGWEPDCKGMAMALSRGDATRVTVRQTLFVSLCPWLCKRAIVLPPQIACSKLQYE